MTMLTNETLPDAVGAQVERGVRRVVVNERTDAMNENELWAKRGRWLVDKLRERTTPDGRTVLELVDEPIWARADGILADYCSAVDAAMERDESYMPPARFEH